MYSDYFVLVTDEVFGVFEESAKGYPLEFKQNLKYVESVNYSDLSKYLLEKVGRNILVNKEFGLPYSIGRLYSRTPS